MAIKKLKGNSQWDTNNYDVAFEYMECNAKVEFNRLIDCIPTFCHLEVKQ